MGRLALFLPSSIVLVGGYVVGLLGVAPYLSFGVVRYLDDKYPHELFLTLYLLAPMAFMVGLAYALGIWRRNRHLLVKVIAAVWSIAVSYGAAFTPPYVACIIYGQCL